MQTFLMQDMRQLDR